jgi:hypothetical protein
MSLFQNPSDFRRQRIGLLEEQALRQREMGGSMAGLLGQVAAGTGGMFAEGIAGAMGLKTDAETKAEKVQNLVASIEAEPGTLEWFEEASARLKDINPDLALEMADKANTLKQQNISNENESKRLDNEDERIQIANSQLKLAQSAQRIADATFKSGEDEKKARLGAAKATMSSTPALKALGFGEEFVTTLRSAGKDEKEGYAQLVADRMESYGKLSSASDAPASVKEYQFFTGLSPEEQEKYVSLKRKADTSRIDQGDKVVIVDNTSGAVIEEFKKELAPDETPEYKGEVKKVEGFTDNAVNYLTQDGPKVLKAGEPMLATIGNVRRILEGLDATSEAALFGSLSVPADNPETGEPSALWRLAPASAKEANSYLKQLRGQAFLKAFQMLKGGGTITNLEGSKAEASLNRLSDRVLFGSKQEVLQALDELENGVKEGLNATNAKMEEYNKMLNGGGVEKKEESAPKSRVRVYNPDTGEFE